MAGIKSLAKDTVVYGLSSIIGKFLNWCLVPLYTHMFTETEYGVVTYLYSLVALLLTMLTYGMETGFFRFANHEKYNDPIKVYTTALISLASTSILFLLAVVLFIEPITSVLGNSGDPRYILMLAATLSIDAFTALPFAYLRYKSRPVRFAGIKLLSIFLNIGLNLFFIVLCPQIHKIHPEWVSWCYDASFGVGYIFLSNLIASLVTLAVLIPEIFGVRYRFDKEIWHKMISYSFPLLIMGLAGIMNQTIDKLIYPMLVPDTERAMTELGIYGANYKIAIVMVMFFLPVLKYFIAPSYFVGLAVVPIVMAGEFFFGIFFNLSLWYKLTDRTYWGTWLSLLGLIVTLAINIAFVPRYGYMACAWAAFCCYLTMMIVSYLLGRKYYPLPYKWKAALRYTVLAALLYTIAMVVPAWDLVWTLLFRSVLLLAYIVYVIRCDMPLREWPVIGKYFK